MMNEQLLRQEKCMRTEMYVDLQNNKTMCLDKFECTLTKIYVHSQQS